MRSSIAALALLFITVTPSHAWVMSVEFPFAAIPRPLWERDLAHLKEMGVTHVSLPPSTDPAQLDDLIRIVRTLGLEADLEGAIPERLQLIAKAHGGPLTEALSGAVRISATMPRALDNERKLLTSGTPAIVWTDAFETLTPWRDGAIHLAGAETESAAVLRREAQLARYWGPALSNMPEVSGARAATPLDSMSVHQYVADRAGTAPAGLSFASITNDSPDPWKGDLRVLYPVLQRPIGLPAVTVAPRDVLWLPVNIPLVQSALCSGCNGFAPSDHLAYATSELTAMEYENGILAMEFIASSPGEAVLQLSHEPLGPLMAAGHPAVFDWDPKTFRARLPIPAGNKTTGHVRVALAIDAPPATASFESAPALLIGETNILGASFSPAAVASRSRLRAAASLGISQEASAPDGPDQPAWVRYKIMVPASAIPGDSAALAVEADGMQLSHVEPRVLPALSVTFADSVTVRVAAGSSLPILPATVPVNQRTGREIAVSIRNNAPGIRTFEVSLRVPGLDFSPEKMTVNVGASIARNVTFRVFSSGTSVGIHEGHLRVSGAAALAEPIRFVVLPPTGTVSWSGEGLQFLETAKRRASFLGDRWLELLDKDSGMDSKPAGGTPFTGPVESLQMEDLLNKTAGTSVAPANR